MWRIARSELVKFLKVSMSPEVKKGPFAALIIGALKNVCNVYQETNVVLFTYYQR